MSLDIKVGYAYRRADGQKSLIKRTLVDEASNKVASFLDNNHTAYFPNGTAFGLDPKLNLVEELFECHGLDDQDIIHFYEQDFYCFSNFSSFMVAWKGIYFQTLEHAYHWEKFRDPNNPESQVESLLARGVRSARSAHDSFSIAQKHKSERRSDWDRKAVKVRIMFELLIEKTKQHEYVKNKLLKSKGRKLTENSWRDGFWGAFDNGLDVLGQLWMLVREIVEAGKLNTINPKTYPLDSIVTIRLEKGGLYFNGNNTVVEIVEIDRVPEVQSGWVAKDSGGLSYYPDGKVYPVSIRSNLELVRALTQTEVSEYLEQTTLRQKKDVEGFDLTYVFSEPPLVKVIKVPLPVGIEDTPAIREKIQKLLSEEYRLEKEDRDLVQQLRGRARFLKDRGEVKTPDLLEEAASALLSKYGE